MNDIVRHALFPAQALYVVGREVDLIARTITIALDLLSSDKDESSPFPVTPANLDD